MGSWAKTGKSDGPLKSDNLAESCPLLNHVRFGRHSFDVADVPPLMVPFLGHQGSPHAAFPVICCGIPLQNFAYGDPPNDFKAGQKTCQKFQERAFSDVNKRCFRRSHPVKSHEGRKSLAVPFTVSVSLLCRFARLPAARKLGDWGRGGGNFFSR